MWLILIVIMSLVAYRVTHFLIEDTLIDTPRTWLLTLLIAGEKESAWREKLAELLQCYWCLGMWISALTVMMFDQFISVPLPWLTMLAVAQGTMLVSVLFAIVED